MSPDQSDTLQEVVNIAMGQAANSLARVLDIFVAISVPRMRVVKVTSISPSIREFVNHMPEVSAVRQSFFHDLRGEAFTIFGSSGCNALADLLGYEDGLDQAAQQEMLLDVSNILVGACLNGIADQLGTDLTFSAPTILAEKANPDRLFSPDDLPWNSALWVEVNFKLQERDFQSHLLVMMTEEAIGVLQRKIDLYMEKLQ